MTTLALLFVNSEYAVREPRTSSERAQARDARAEHVGRGPRVRQSLVRRVAELQRQRRLVVRLREAPVVGLRPAATPRHAADSRPANCQAAATFMQTHHLCTGLTTPNP